jgi:hypothetical protein
VQKTEALIQLAREAATAIPDFQAVRGAGAGDHATLSFMRTLRAAALEQFGTDYSEKKICGDNSFAVDFYIPEESTIVEVALGLPNPACEFEKDILKAIMAQDRGVSVDRLVFISRAGAAKKCDQPGRSAVRSWAKTTHHLEIEVHELGGVPRVRKRKKKPQSL